MYEFKVTLDTIEKVKEFVAIVSKLDGDYDLISGKYVVDAKSMLGIFSVDLSKPMILRADGRDGMEEVKEQIKAYLVQE